MNVNGEYLIPSLLLLKKKVDKIFGSQKVVSLSEDRPAANEMTCGDESGYLQFKLFAENILKQNSISIDHSIIPDSKPDQLDTVDSTNPTNPTNPTNEEAIILSNNSSIKSEASSFDNLFLNEDEWDELLNEVTENEEVIHPEVSTITQENEIHSSILLSFISQFEKTTVSNPSLPSSISSSQVVHTYSYSIQPPSRSLHSLQHHMKERGIPPVYYNDLTGFKEFNPTGFLASYSTSLSLSHSTQTNRILFWKDLLHDQFNTYFIFSLLSILVKNLHFIHISIQNLHLVFLFNIILLFLLLYLHLFILFHRILSLSLLHQHLHNLSHLLYSFLDSF